jgi:hypothetical protein
MAREPFFLNETLMISWFGFGYIYRLGIFRCLVRLKDQKLRFASTVSTHSPNMLWAWLAENGFCFFGISVADFHLQTHHDSEFSYFVRHLGACWSVPYCIYESIVFTVAHFGPPKMWHWFVWAQNRRMGFGSSPMLTNAMHVFLGIMLMFQLHRIKSH